VKEQTSAYLEKARELLDQADTMLGVDLNEAAGRTAYLAGFHAAQALIFENTGRVYKTHGGLQGEFSRLVKDDPRVDDQLRAFLGRSYNLKSVADYETGPTSHVSAESAREAIQTARRFVERVAGLMPAQQQPTLAERFGRSATREAEPGPEQDHERGNTVLVNTRAGFRGQRGDGGHPRVHRISMVRATETGTNLHRGKRPTLGSSSCKRWHLSGCDGFGA